MVAPAFTATLSIGFTLVGGTAAQLLSSGTAAQLRAAAASLTAVPGARALIRSVQVVQGTVDAAVLNSGLGSEVNSSSAMAALFGGSPQLTTVASFAVAEDDPQWNAPLQPRRLSLTGATTGTGRALQAASTATRLVSVGMDVIVTITGANSTADADAAVAALQQTVTAGVNSPPTAAAVFGATVSSWAAVTGIPAQLGMILSVIPVSATVAVAAPTPVPAPGTRDNGLVPVLPAVLATVGALLLAYIGIIAFAWRRRRGNNDDTELTVATESALRSGTAV